MALRKKKPVYVDPLQEARDAALGATFSFQHAVNELLDANAKLESVKSDSLATIAVYQARHDDAHAAVVQNAHVVGKLKDILGLDTE